MNPYSLTSDEKRMCRRLAKEQGPVAVYARLSLAASEGRGLRLSADEIDEVLKDTAVSDAIIMAVVSKRGDVPW